MGLIPRMKGHLPLQHVCMSLLLELVQCIYGSYSVFSLVLDLFEIHLPLSELPMVVFVGCVV